MADDAIREAMTPGTITTLGALRPGDVGRYIVHQEDTEEEFLVCDRRGACVYVQYPNSTYSHYGDVDAPMVRYLGRGCIEPARIVMDGGPDRVAELEEQVRTLREAVREAWKNLNPARYVLNDAALDLFSEKDVANGVLAAWEILNQYAALAVTAPKGEPCTT